MATSAFQKPWLPLARSAEKISYITGNEPSVGDILRAALQSELTLSIQLDTPVLAISGRFQHRLNHENKAFVCSTDEGDCIQGLLDLLLVGNGKIHIENLQRKILGEPEIVCQSPGGTFLEAPGGPVWEILQEERSCYDLRIVLRTSELEKFLNNAHGIAPCPTPTPQEIKKILSEHQPGPIQLVSFEELCGDHRIHAKKALRLGIEGKIRFFVPVEKATIVWEEAIVSGDGEEIFDPQCNLDIDEALYFQVAPQSLSEIFRSGETSHIRILFPESIKDKIGSWKPGTEYRSRIEINSFVCPVPLWPELSRNPEGPKETPARERLGDLEKQRARTIEGLFILNEDIAAYEEERAECNLAKQQSTADQSALVKEPTADDVIWGWKNMEEFTGLTRGKIRYRAGRRGFELKKENPDDVKIPGLTVSELNKILNSKRSNAAT